MGQAIGKFMARRIIFILIWTGAFFFAAYAIWGLLAWALFSIAGRENDLVRMFLAIALFTLIPVSTLTGAGLAFLRRLPGTRVEDIGKE